MWIGTWRSDGFVMTEQGRAKKTLSSHFLVLLLLLPLSVFARPGADAIAAATSQYTTLGGQSIHYKLLGEAGPVTLLVHGGGCDLTFWELQVTALAQSGRVLLIDLPGHGKSDAPQDTRYSMKLHGAAINQVMEAADVDSAMVVGHSLGVPALREFYRGWPDKVEGFVAVDGILIYEEPGFAMDAMIWLMDTWLYDYIWPSMVEGMTSEATPQWGRDKVNQSMKNAPHYLVRSFFTEMYHAETAVNDAIDVPLLAIYAENPTWTDEVKAQIRALSGDAQLVMMPEVSHFLMLDRPEETNQLLIQFNQRTRKQTND